MSKISKNINNSNKNNLKECISKGFGSALILTAFALLFLLVSLFCEGKVKQVLLTIIYVGCAIIILLIIFSTICFIISKNRNKQNNWIKWGVFSLLGAVICGAFTVLWALLMIYLKGRIVLISLIAVYIFSILSSLCLIFAIICFIIAKVKWCKKIENNINTILENTKK